MQLTTSANSPSVKERADAVISYVDGLTSALAKETGFSQYFCLKVLMSFPKELYSTNSAESDYLKEQGIYDYLCEGDKDNLDKFLESWGNVMDYKVEAYLFRRMIGPDIFRIQDAAGKRINYSLDAFEQDLRSIWQKLPELAGQKDWDNLWQYLVDLYTKLDPDKFFEIVYKVHDSCRQTEYWGQNSGRSIVTVRSRIGRRAPSWGWD